MRNESFLILIAGIIAIFILSGCAKEPIKEISSDDSSDDSSDVSSEPNMTNEEALNKSELLNVENPFEPLADRDVESVAAQEEIEEPVEKIALADKRIAVRMFRFGIEPSTITVKKGETIMLTITSTDVGHGFALPDFGVNKNVPPEESVTVQFVADKAGEFEFFESVYSGAGWKEMKGKLIVTK